MQDLFRDKVMEIIAANGMWIAGGVAAVAGLVMLLGMLKKLLAAMLAASLNAGDAAARKLAEKPKAVMLALSVFALAVTGLWAWHTFTAPKIVEREVVRTVTVKDDTADAAIAEARGKYGQAETARSDAEAKANALENRLATVEQARKQDEQARKQAENQIVSLTAQLRQLSPPDDDRALSRSSAQLDTLHQAGVESETSGNFDYRRFKQVGFTYYHRKCAICDQNSERGARLPQFSCARKRRKGPRAKLRGSSGARRRSKRSDKPRQRSRRRLHGQTGSDDPCIQANPSNPDYIFSQ